MSSKEMWLLHTCFIFSMVVIVGVVFWLSAFWGLLPWLPPESLSNPVEQRNVFYLHHTFCAVLPPSGWSKYCFCSSSFCIITKPRSYMFLQGPDFRGKPTLSRFFKIICLKSLHGKWTTIFFLPRITQDWDIGSEALYETFPNKTCF